MSGARAMVIAAALVVALPVQSAAAQSTGTVRRIPRSESTSGTSGTSGTGTSTTGTSTTTSTTSTTGAASGADRAPPPSRMQGAIISSGAHPDDTGDHEDDDGRKVDFFWLELQGGISYVNLVAFSQTQFSGGGASVTVPGFNEVEGSGPSIGVGAGFRVFWFGIGARATYAFYPGFEIGTVGGEVTLRLPVPIVEPWIRVGAGYAWQGNGNYSSMTMSVSPATTVYGWNVNGGLGLDVFITWWLAIGVGLELDLLNMTRQSDPTAMCMGVTEFCPREQGDALGGQARGFVTLAFHF